MHTLASKSTILLLGLICLLFGTSDVNHGQTALQEVAIGLNAVTVEWSPDGSLIAVGTESGVSIFTAGLQFVAVLPGYTQQVVSLSWSPDSQHIAGVGYPYQVGIELYVPVFTSSLLVWQRDINNNFSLFQKIDYPDQTNVVGVEWSPDNSRLAVRTSEFLPRSDTVFADIQIWNTVIWNIESSLQNTYRSMYANLAWNADGSLLAGGADAWCYELRPCNTVGDVVSGTIIFLIDPSTGDRISYAYTGLPTDGISWSSNNQIAVASAEIRIYDNTLASIVRETTAYEQYGLKWMPNQNELLLWSYDGTIDIVDSIDFTSRFNLPVADLQDLSLSPNGNLLAVLASTHLSIYDISVSTACDLTIPASDTAALLSAITSANNAGTPQTLCLTNSIYTLTAVNNTTDGSNGLPSIVGDITIVGDGATIEFPSGSGFNVSEGGKLTLRDVLLATSGSE